MKRIFSLILSILLVISLCACRRQQASFEAPVQFYYRSASLSYNSENAVICAESREGSGYALIDLMDLYLQGPVSNEYQSPFPTGVTVLSMETVEDKVYIALSEPFAELNGIALTLACACLSKTVMEFTGTSAVEISVPNTTLNGSASIVMDAQNILLLDSSS